MDGWMDERTMDGRRTVYEEWKKQRIHDGWIEDEGMKVQKDE